MVKVWENGEIIEIPDEEATRPSPDSYNFDAVLSVTASQAKIALLRAGHLDTVENLIANYPREIQIWYDKALHWERYNPYVQGFAIELGLTDDEVNQLFEAAAKL